ncbi:PLP-dependent transferase [Marasmius fiardii PR-910]|nr:PLP-dependent transferase [Marasmius fiardii PR-910]
MPTGITVLPPSFYEQFLSEQSLKRKPSAIRSLFPLEKKPGVLTLLAGKPNASTFPFTSLSFTARCPSPDPALLGPSGGPRDTDVHVNITPEDLALGLQYSDTAGVPALLEWLQGLQEKMHGRQANGEGWRISVGSGSQDLIFKAVNSIVNPGDPVLVETPMYAGVIPMFVNLKCELYEVETDAEGISSNSLRQILEAWPQEKPKPKVLYTVPYGCNPTGMTASLARRKEVLKLAREHNFLILEDDPYYYLYYGTAERVPSYFTLELEEPEVGRVLRFDSLSKILSSGLRVGFATGPDRLLAAIDANTATSNLQSSSLTQVLAIGLLKQWGYDGFLTHTRGISAFYGQKRDVFEAAMNRHLKGLCEWVAPQAGMFFWFKLIVPDEDSNAIIRTKAFENGILALPGNVFNPNGGKSAYVRASFSLLTPEDVEEAVKRLAKTIKEARGM